MSNPNDSPLAPPRDPEASRTPLELEALERIQTLNTRAPDEVEARSGSSRGRPLAAEWLGETVWRPLFEQRTVVIAGPIDEAVATATVSQLIVLERKDSSRAIQVLINSPGGVVSAGMAICDVLRSLSCPVATVCFGQAASMAAVLLSAGTRGRRLALPNARLMIHQPLRLETPECGSSHDAELVHARGVMVAALSETTGRSAREVAADIECDRYMTPVQAIHYGLIDQVVNRIDLL